MHQRIQADVPRRRVRDLEHVGHLLDVGAHEGHGLCDPGRAGLAAVALGDGTEELVQLRLRARVGATCGDDLLDG